MHGEGIREKGRAYVGEVMAALLFIQPLLDVLSYFMRDTGSTAVTTFLRTVLLFTVSLYGFSVSRQKKAYAVLYAVVGGFWLLHMLNCFRTGYAQPVEDAAEYLKLIQFPLWTFSFLTFLRNREGLDRRTAGMLALNFGLILLVIALSYAVGRPVYTYDYPERGMQIGVLGWFAVANAQSAILTMLVPPLLLWAFRKEKLWVFCVSCALGFGLLYLTGTRLTYFGALLSAGVFLALILVGRKRLLCCVPLVLSIALLLVFRGASPMAERQARTADSYSIFREKADVIMGEDKDFVFREGEEIPPQVLEKIRRVYTDIYGEEGLYGTMLLGDLIDRFGVDAVMKQYKYSTRPEDLYNTRTKKLMALRMIWKEKDFFTKFLGFEYAEVTLGDNIYDPENDFPALLFYYGYLGAALYLAFAAFFPLLALYQFLRNIRRLPEFLTPELGTYGLMFAMALGAALFSGQALRKPNVTVYFSVAGAQLYHILRDQSSTRTYTERLDRNVATRKKV